MNISPDIYFYLKPSGNGYMDGFYIIRNGDYVTKLDSYCSFNILSNYQSDFIHFDKEEPLDELIPPSYDHDIFPADEDGLKRRRYQILSSN